VQPRRRDFTVITGNTSAATKRKEQDTLRIARHHEDVEVDIGPIVPCIFNLDSIKNEWSASSLDHLTPEESPGDWAILIVLLEVMTKRNILSLLKIEPQSSIPLPVNIFL
jgi:hypothetical protein